MTTKLDKALKREISLNNQTYVLTLTPEGLKLTLKGRRKGHELKWVDLVSGEAALAVALNASLQRAGAHAHAATGNREDSSPPPRGAAVKAKKKTPKPAAPISKRTGKPSRS